MDTNGIVFDIQRCALHDGPGLRTTVFLKGCPLRCVWCHNPESQRFQPETGCSGRVYGRQMTTGEVMTVAMQDLPFYAASGGGVTLSGGEPTSQYEFCRSLLDAARAAGLHTCLDTCGALDWPRLRELIPLVSLFLYDYKATGRETHARLTGIDDQLPRGNLLRLLEAGASVRLRCPLVPGVNDDDRHLVAVRDLVERNPGLALDIMPYHEIGRAKYGDLGLPAPDLETGYSGFLVGRACWLW